MRRRTGSSFRAALLCLAAASPQSAAQAAPALTAIYSFQGGTDGAAPVSGLTYDVSHTSLFGTTSAGGGAGCNGAGCGTIYKLTPPGVGQTQWNETVLYSFTGGADGAAPMAALTPGPNGVFFSTTSAGGLGFGTVFRITPPAAGQTTWTEEVIYAFSGGADGSMPLASLLRDRKGNLYGTTYQGGDVVRLSGTVFRLSPPQAGGTVWSETTIWQFQAGGKDGAHPTTPVTVDSAGILYGSTSYSTITQSGGGGIPYCGTIYSLTPAQDGTGSYTEATLYALAKLGQYPCIPTGPLYRDVSGVLYTTALTSPAFSVRGGTMNLSPPAPGQTAWTPTNIDFNNTDFNFRPFSGFVPDSIGNLYGTSAGIFRPRPDTDAGAYVFELLKPATPGTWTQKILARFDSTTGILPKSPLLRTNDGTIYGTAEAGGNYGFGTVFALTRPGK